MGRDGKTLGELTDRSAPDVGNLVRLAHNHCSVVPTVERSPWEPLLTEESVEPWSKDRTTPLLQMSYPALEAFCNDEDKGKGRSRSVAY
jgi:hypothetical protein